MAQVAREHKTLSSNLSNAQSKQTKNIYVYIHIYVYTHICCVCTYLYPFMATNLVQQKSQSY
jgi:hypothetical protein